MDTLTTWLSRSPHEILVGVIDYGDTFTVGFIEDPVGIILSDVHLAYPLNYMKKVENTIIIFGFLYPQEGVPEETIRIAEDYSTYIGTSPIALSYVGALRDLQTSPPREKRIRWV